MQMDWTTFVLEVINFLVLVWLLRHFFYRPVLAVLDARQTRVMAVKDEAATLYKDAEALKAQYDARIAAWSTEQDAARQKLDQELLLERNRSLGELKLTLADEEAKSRARGDAAALVRESSFNRQAMEEAYGAAAAILQRLASPALTSHIAQVFGEDLAAMPEEDRATLQQAVTALGEQETIDIASAHPLAEATRRELTKGLERAAGRHLQTHFREVPELLAGLRVAVGQCRLDASLSDELAFFRKMNRHA